MPVPPRRRPRRTARRPRTRPTLPSRSRRGRARRHFAGSSAFWRVLVQDRDVRIGPPRAVLEPGEVAVDRRDREAADRADDRFAVHRMELRPEAGRVADEVARLLGREDDPGDVGRPMGQRRDAGVDDREPPRRDSPSRPRRRRSPSAGRRRSSVSRRFGRHARTAAVSVERHRRPPDVARHACPPRLAEAGDRQRVERAPDPVVEGEADAERRGRRQPAQRPGTSPRDCAAAAMHRRACAGPTASCRACHPPQAESSVRSRPRPRSASARTGAR